MKILNHSYSLFDIPDATLAQINLCIYREGGDQTTDHAADRGGLTRFGISQNAFPGLDIAALDREDAQLIYYEHYWLAAHCNELPDVLREIVFDCAVNQGVRTAIRLLQRAIGTAADGVFGPKSRAALRLADPFHTFFNILSGRRRRYVALCRRDQRQLAHLNGWLNRLDKVTHSTLFPWLKCYSDGIARD